MPAAWRKLVILGAVFELGSASSIKTFAQSWKIGDGSIVYHHNHCTTCDTGGGSCYKIKMAKKQEAIDVLQKQQYPGEYNLELSR